MDFKLVSDYAPTGDQPEAIAQLLASIRHGSKHNTLLGVTGSGKTFTVANVISQLNRPTLVLSHNKTLAAQLYGEFKNFFPENAVEYFVSYYDYYQPEAYLPSTDTYIEKDLSINDEIEKMRLSTTATLLSGRRDVIVVSSVSCLYGCGNPSDFHSMAIHIEVGEILNYKQFLYKLVEALYTRTERELTPATFRVTGDTIDIMAAFGEFGNQCFRVTFFDNEVESIQSIDPVTGQRIQTLDALTLYPVSLFVTTKERIHTAVQQIYLDLGKQIAFFEQAGRPAEAQRIKQRVEYDLEMIKELGYCPGIENYSRYFDGRAEGTRPFCLLDYFPQDYLMVIDESHVTLPQVHAMFGGDRARKENLVEYGFRLPAAKDNRPLRFEEFEQLVGTTIYVSATPADYELMKSEGVIVEQLIRPTGLVDPPLEVRITDNQIDDLLEEIDKRVRNDDKILVTTITKRMAEELSKYFDRVGVRNRYIHSDIDTLERVQILEDLRARPDRPGTDPKRQVDRLHAAHRPNRSEEHRYGQPPSGREPELHARQGRGGGSRKRPEDRRPLPGHERRAARPAVGRRVDGLLRRGDGHEHQRLRALRRPGPDAHRPGRLGDHLRTGPFDGHLPGHPRRPGFELLRPPERRKQGDPDQTHGDLQGPLLPPLGLLRGDVRQLGAGAPEGRMGRGRRADAGRKLNDTALK